MDQMPFWVLGYSAQNPDEDTSRRPVDVYVEIKKKKSVSHSVALLQGRKQSWKRDRKNPAEKMKPCSTMPFYVFPEESSWQTWFICYDIR